MTDRPVRRMLALGVALSLAALALAVLPQQRASAASTTGSLFPPTAPPALAGSDRYATAVAVSKDSYPAAGSAKTVVIASGESFPDALSAAPAAVRLGGPLLLTLSDHLPPEVTAEVKRLGPKRIVVVGGTAAVSASVQTALSHIAPTVRVAGADRYGTSLAIAKFAFGSTQVPKVFFATGTAFPDALSASAYAATVGAPVLLVPSNSPPLLQTPDGNLSLLPAGYVSWARGAHIAQYDIVGGNSAIPYSMQLGILRLAGTLGAFVYQGADRFDTNRRIIDDNPDPIYSGVSAAYLASGMNFPDALAGAAAAGKAGEPLILVKPNCVPSATAQMIQTMGISTVKLLGGPTALGPGVARMTACH